MTAPVYWRQPFDSLAIVTDLVEFIVLDIEPSGVTQGKFVLADAQVAPSGAFSSTTGHMDLDDGAGSTDQIYHTRTHLGGILQAGDTVMGYFLSRANFNSEAFEALQQDRIPDVLLVKKSYPNRRKKSANKSRNWRLKSIAKEAEEMGGETMGAGRGALGRRGGVDQKKVELDYEMFLRDIEEDVELRAAVNLYKAEDKAKGDMEMDEDGATATDGDGDQEADFPEIKLDDLLDNFDEMTLQDQDQEQEQQ